MDGWMDRQLNVKEANSYAFEFSGMKFVYSGRLIHKFRVSLLIV